MSHLREALKRADPVQQDPQLSVEETLAMRRTVLRASRVAPVGSTYRWQPLVAAVTLSAFVLIAIGVGTRLYRSPDSALNPVDGVAPNATVRQLRIAAPGGTRIIWTFTDDLEF